MTTESTLILLGILTALVPLIGLPYAWLMVLIPLLGLLISATGIVLRARRLASEGTPHIHKEVTPPPQVLDEAPAA